MFWEYADWPDAWRDAALTKPWHILDLVARNGILHLSPDARVQLDQTDSSAPNIFFPKLGAKSWRDGPGLCPLANDALLPDRIATLLARPTDPQRQLLGVMQTSSAPLRLYLFPWLDMTQWSEARLHVTDNTARLTSYALRTPEPPGDWKASLIAKAQNLSAAVPQGTPIDIDLAFAPEREPHLVEVNPGSLVSI